MCPVVTVFSLSVSTYVGAPPTLRKVTSRAANTLGIVLSRSASTTRNRDQASHAQNSTVLTPSMTGPSPTAGAPAPGPTYMPHAPGRPPGGSSAPTPDSPALPASRAPHRRGSCPSTAPSTPRAWPRTHPPAAAWPPPAHSPRPRHGPAHTVRPCDASTPPAQRHHATTRSGRKLPAFP